MNGSVCVDAHPATMPRRMVLIRGRMGRGARRGKEDEEKEENEGEEESQRNWVAGGG